MSKHISPAVNSVFKNLVTYLNPTSSNYSFFDKNACKIEFFHSRISEFKIYKSEVINLQRIPLYLLKGAFNQSNIFIWRNELSYCSIKDRIKKNLFGSISSHDLPIRIEKCLSELNSSSITFVNKAFCLPLVLNPEIKNVPESELDNLIESFIEKLTELPEYAYTKVENMGYKGTYYDLHSSLTNKYISLNRYKFKDFEISSSYGALIDFKNKKVLAMLTLNPEYLEYFLLKTYTKTPGLIPDIFNITVDETFFKRLDKTYTKELLNLVKKGLIEPLGPQIKLELIDGQEFFNQLYSNEITQQLSSLGPIEEIEENALMQEDFLQYKTTATTLFERKIQLVDV